MTRIGTALAALAVAAFIGCGAPTDPKAASTSEAGKMKKDTFICHMGADCGKSDVGAGEKVPSCCGKVMVKADTFACKCGKSKISEAGKPSPECCGAPMTRKATP